MNRLMSWLSSRLYLIGISLVYKTARIRTVGEERIFDGMDKGQKILFGFFHGDYLLLFPRFSHRDICAFTTQSARGELLSRIMQGFGYRPCLISDKRGNQTNLQRMAAEIQEGSHAVIVVDGPLGPYRKVKHGIVVLAKQTGHSIVPVGVASAWRIIFKKRWDRYTIPLPFTRAVIAYGDPVTVPEDADDEAIERYRDRLEKTLLDLNRLALESLEGAAS